MDWEGLGENPASELQLFAGLSGAEQVNDRLGHEIDREVAAILTAVRNFDAFDVIELLRLREIPPVPVLGLEEGYDGSAAVVDLVTLVLLTREARIPAGSEGENSRPHEVVPELHDRAKRLLRLASYAIAARAAVGNDPLARLASEYQSHLISVRSMQYESVQANHDRALFDCDELDQLLTPKIGFTYRDFAAVRAAIQQRYSRTLTELRDTTADIVMAAQAEGRELSVSEEETFRDAMVNFMFLPGKRASFTATHIAGESGVDPARVEAVLHAFSVGFDSGREASKIVKDFLRGVNPMARTSLVSDSDGNYIMTGLQIGTDSFRSIAESAIKPDSRAWRRYDRIRATVSEATSISIVERLLQSRPAHTNLKYIAPKDSHEVSDLASTCTAPYSVGDQTECDALFIVEDVAICVEVKGRTIADTARRGDLARLRNEIRQTFGGAAEQARRLEALIEANQGLWLENGEWLDLSSIREVRSIVVGLDFFGPLAVALGDLERAALLPKGRLPWVASLHDLDVISRVLARPAEFLLYLRRRSDSGVATHYRGLDELDLFMLFLDGGLYVEPDPDEIRRLHPNAGPAPNRNRRQQEQDARPTIVATHTDQLDAWMYRLEGTSPYDVDKPIFNANNKIQRIVDFLADGHKPGWFRFGADLLGLAGPSQKALADAMEEMVKKTRNDERWHSLVQGYAGMWGYPTFFAATCPRSHSRREAIDKLATYMAAKKHQMQSDRSLSILLGLDGQIVHVGYKNDPPTENDDLDNLGQSLGLAPAGYSTPPIPPSAKRPTRRLRGQRRKKK